MPKGLRRPARGRPPGTRGPLLRLGSSAVVA